MRHLPRNAGATATLVLTAAIGYWAPMTLHAKPAASAQPAAQAQPAAGAQLAAQAQAGTAPDMAGPDGRARATDSAVTAPTGLPSFSAAAAFPGLGPQTAAAIPASADQVVVVRGTGGSDASVSLYVVGTAGWTALHIWQARIGRNGWVRPEQRRDGDLRTPVGVFTLSDAGGRSAAPSGTALPYTRTSRFQPPARGVSGEPLTGVFDHVVAIDFNRVPGRSPLDAARPDGAARGGGIWLHVDHDGPTRGCVGVPRSAMVDLLRTLTPSAHPVVVMGPAADLDR